MKWGGGLKKQPQKAVPLGAQSPKEETSPATRRAKRSGGVPKIVGSWDQGKRREEDSRLEEARSGPARVAATPVGKCVGLFLCCSTAL